VAPGAIGEPPSPIGVRILLFAKTREGSIEMKSFWFGWVCVWMVLAGCATTPPQPLVLSVEDLPDLNIIRVTNGSGSRARISYSYLPEFGPLQMFLMRFRDRNGTIFPVSGSDEGWFTPKVHSASLGRAPRRTLIVPANGSIDFQRDVEYFAGFTRWTGARDTGPCEVQIKLFGYRDNDRERPVEAVSEWRRGLCPM
jgi:hypothetical protein